jgi:hypothetical protein
MTYVATKPVAARIVSEKPYFASGSFILFHNDCLSTLSCLPENSPEELWREMELRACNRSPKWDRVRQR